MKVLVTELQGLLNTTVVLSIYFWPIFIREGNTRSQREDDENKAVIYIFSHPSSHAPGWY